MALQHSEEKTLTEKEEMLCNQLAYYWEHKDTHKNETWARSYHKLVLQINQLGDRRNLVIQEAKNRKAIYLETHNER